MSALRSLYACTFGPSLSGYLRIKGLQQLQIFSKTIPLALLQQSPNRYYQRNQLDPFSEASQVNAEFINTVAPALKRSYNLAAYINESKTLQKLISMGISLFDVESISMQNAQYLLQLDFDRDCAPHIRFLVDNGLKQDRLGWFISENPVIFKESLEDLQVRINYFLSKGFTNQMIINMLNKSGRIWSHKTKTIDHNLGVLQVEFQLPAKVVRKIVSKHPTSVLLPHGQLNIVNFSFREEYGFTREQMHQLLGSEPKILSSDREDMFLRFDLIHREMKLSHGVLVRNPKLFTCPIEELRWRYRYLRKLNRAQFDPKLPLYVPLNALYDCDDDEFCTKYAKTNLEDYKLYLKYV